MSVQVALRFIQHMREDKQYHGQIKTVSNVTLDAVVQLGAQAGYPFSEQDLRIAFKHDWAMRWIRYGKVETQMGRGAGQNRRDEE